MIKPYKQAFSLFWPWFAARGNRTAPVAFWDNGVESCYNGNSKLRLNRTMVVASKLLRFKLMEVPMSNFKGLPFEEPSLAGRTGGFPLNKLLQPTKPT